MHVPSNIRRTACYPFATGLGGTGQHGRGERQALKALIRELGVSFQQIVHPVLTEETEVAEASDSEGKPDEHA